MLMVIFGAGASYDSVPEDEWGMGQGMAQSTATTSGFSSPYRPPLTIDLFSKREPFDQALGVYPRCGGLIGELRSVVARKAPLEESLQQYREMADAGNDDLGKQLLALRFYLRKIIEECASEWMRLAAWVTNYRTLLNRLERHRRETGEQVLLVTFNYDEMLEAALIQTVGANFQELDDYLDGSQGYRLFKPHGSTSWRQLVGLSTGTTVEQLIEEFGSYRIREDFIVKSDERTDSAFIPALAIPTVAKSLYECPSLHMETLRRDLPDVDRLLVVGWRAQEKTFLDLLSEGISKKPTNMPPLQGLVVSGTGESASNVAGLLREALDGADIRSSPSRGFSNFLRDEDPVGPLWRRGL